MTNLPLCVLEVSWDLTDDREDILEESLESFEAGLPKGSLPFCLSYLKVLRLLMSES